MAYTIDIIDTTNPDVVLELKAAGAKSLHLSWNGGDDKLPRIVSTSFKFTMHDDENQDGRYDILYTGNETKYKVNIIHDASHTVIWQGFLLPDLYSEPYTNNVVFVDFEATDGLGRLKGKYLPNDFYSEEKSVIQIISACLRATGLELDLFFAPAIENTIVKDYDAIYLDTEKFIDGNKKKDAYAILTTLVEDMMCVLYQADNRWYFEGVNRRQIRVINYKNYNSDGTFVGMVEFTKLIKEHNALVTPFVTIVSPYGSINVSQKASVVKLPETIQQEKNDGWAVPPGSNARVLATDWLGYGGFDAYAQAYDYKVSLKPANGGKLFTDIDFDAYVRLREKIYVQVGDMYHFSLSTTLVLDNEEDPLGLIGGVLMELSINGTLIKNIQLSFDFNHLNKVAEFDFVVQESGLLDMKIYEPFLSITYSRVNNVLLYRNFVFDKLELIKLNNTEDIFIENTVNDEFTLTMPVDLTFGDDASGFSDGFRLAKLKTSIAYIIKEVKVKYPITFLGENYVVVDLTSANLIADNITSVYYDDELLEDLEVIYNFNNGEEMVVKTTDVIAAGETLLVYVYAKNDLFGNRDHWQQWTDVLYQIEKNRYAQVVADIYRRMHNVAHYKIDMTLNRSVKFNDIITFPYKQDQNYIITNCTWDLDSNETTVTAIKGYYLNSVVTNPGDNISPIVDAGVDKTLPVATTSTTLTAIASDPDGFIVSYLWEQISGASTTVISSPSNASTLVSNLLGTGDYVFRVTVTDNEGATAQDTVTVRKNVSYTIELIEDCVSDTATPFGSTLHHTIYNRRKIVSLSITPALPVGASLILTFKLTTFEVAQNSITDYDDYIATPACVPVNALPPTYIQGRRGLELVVNPDGYNAAYGFGIVKNGAMLYGANNHVYTNPNTVDVSVLGDSEIYLVMDHSLRIYVSSANQSLFGAKTNKKIELINAVVNTGAGTITGFPITINAYNDFWPALITPVIVSSTVATTSISLGLVDYNSASPETINIYVEYTENVPGVDDDWQVHGNVPRTSTSYVVTGLNSGVDYKIRCKSVVNLETFESEYSNILNLRTL